MGSGVQVKKIEGSFSCSHEATDNGAGGDDDDDNNNTEEVCLLGYHAV
jgi:hypothetical protein